MDQESLIKKPVFTDSSYRPLPPTVTIQKSSLDGLGLHATTEIDTDVELGISHYWDFTNSRWLRTPLGGFINHSDSPNCILIPNRLKNHAQAELILVTQKKIDSQEELTVYYKLDEYYQV